MEAAPADPASQDPRWPSSTTAAAELRVKRKTLEAVLEQCQLALQMIRDSDLSPCPASDDPMAAAGTSAGVEEADVAADLPLPPPTGVDYETDEITLCDLLKSKVESADFLEKLSNNHKSVYHSNADETSSWDMVSATDLWDDKHIDGDSETGQDGYVVVRQGDIEDGIACFVATYLQSLKETKEITPNKLQEALSKAFSVRKKKGKLLKAWDGTKVIYNVASWSATAIGIYQNPAIMEAASAAFWTSCRVISKFL